MRSKAVFCIAGSEFQAMKILQQLKEAGFANDDLSALVPDKTGTKDFGHELHTKAPEGAMIGSLVAGAVCGGLGWLAGWLANLGWLVLPGWPAILAAGPVMTALSAAAVGLLAGGLAGALVGLGRPEFEARRYEGKLREGNILISVHCQDSRAVDCAGQVFEAAGARHVAAATLAAVKRTARAAIQPA